jgi:hypothetical protein
MKKRLLNITCFFLSVSSLYALDALDIGATAELNANTRRGVAIGGGLLFALELDYRFTTGIKASFHTDMDTVKTLEGLALFRYYLPLPINGIFVQAEAGAIVFIEEGESYPAFLGSLNVGWRIFQKERWYFEPGLRLGYPHIWGISIGGGFRFEI